MSDENLLQIVSTPVTTIQDVIDVMINLDNELADDDGLKWFNKLYLIVTDAVERQTRDHVWSDPEWLKRLDVVFAGLYFNAIRDMIIAPGSVHTPWKVLFEARRDPRLMHVQFAICGMNAHINHDLQFALVQTGEELGAAPEKGSRQHQDFEFVNGILESVMPDVKRFLIDGDLKKLDHDLGRLDDILAIWGVKEAREFAWNNAEDIWPIRHIPLAVKIKDAIVDGSVGVIGRAILIPAL
jgi:Family of unknown function (DUF5995)